MMLNLIKSTEFSYIDFTIQQNEKNTFTTPSPGCRYSIRFRAAKIVFY